MPRKAVWAKERKAKAKGNGAISGLEAMVPPFDEHQEILDFIQSEMAIFDVVTRGN